MAPHSSSSLIQVSRSRETPNWFEKIDNIYTTVQYCIIGPDVDTDNGK